MHNYVQFIKQFELRLMNTFQQVCRAEIANSNRCSLDYRLNREFVMASYLYKVHIQSHIFNDRARKMAQNYPR